MPAAQRILDGAWQVSGAWQIAAGAERGTMQLRSGALCQRICSLHTLLALSCAVGHSEHLSVPMPIRTRTQSTHAPRDVALVT